MLRHLLLAAAALLLVPWNQAHAYQMCEGLSPGDGFPAEGIPRVMHVPKNARMVCSGGKGELFVTVRAASRPVPPDCRCADKKCACRVAETRGGEGIYVLRDSEGQLRSLDAGGGSPFRGEPYPGKAGTATMDLLRVVSTETLRPWLDDAVPRAISTCFTLPERFAADRSHTFVLVSESGSSGLSVIEFTPATIEPPQVPRLAPISFYAPEHRCSSYGTVRFEPLLPREGVVYLWQVETEEGERVFGPYLARAPATGSRVPASEGLELNERYVLVARGVNMLGQTSAPVRIPFEIRQLAKELAPARASNAPLTRDAAVPDQPTAIDYEKKLMWQGCAAGLSGTSCQMIARPKDCIRADSHGAACTWQQALLFCEGLTWGGKSDWRLPNRDELWSILDKKEASDTTANIDANAFPSTPPSRFWSSSPVQEYPDQAWIITFGYGYLHAYLGKSYTAYVRCVRDGV